MRNSGGQPEESSERSSGGTCPVRHNGESDQSSSSLSAWSWLGQRTSTAGAAKSGDAVVAVPSAAAATGSCSVDSVEEAANHAQTPQPDQRLRLDTHRQISSIPRRSHNSTENNSGNNNDIPHHQRHVSSKETNWVYPSEQQMFNAMRKKGWNNVQEEDMEVVLQIHNAVNEGTWQKICAWESTDALRLVKFEGRPRDLTPKAFVYAKLLHWSPLPFDRHDWYVVPSESGNDDNDDDNNNNNKDSSSTKMPSTRYVIDYYMMDPPPGSPPNLPPTTHIDVRPALDGPRGFYLRGKRFLQQALPGITTAWYQWQQRQQSSSSTAAAAAHKNPTSRGTTQAQGKD